MIKVEAIGYVKKPETKQTKAGKEYNSFGINCITGKNLDGSRQYGFLFVKEYDTANHTRGPLPEDGTLVKVTGNLSVREYEKDGVKQKAVEVLAFTVEVNPPKAGMTNNTPPQKAQTPADDFPF